MEMVIFCGIQATGKTSFYKEKFFKTHMRISLDQLNTRNKERVFMAACFAVQQPFVVDNTNPAKADRARYIAEAKQHKFKVTGYYFQSRIEDALNRNNHRLGKENIPEIGIKGTFGKLELPDPNEGFDALYFVAMENNRFVISDWKQENSGRFEG